MPTIKNYIDNEQILTDIVLNVDFKNFIDFENDITTTTVNLGGGEQGQAQALSKKAVTKVIDKIIITMKEKNIDIKEWICSEDEFHLCSKLNNTSTGELMTNIDKYLNNKIAQNALIAAGLTTLFIATPISAVITIITALIFANNGIIEFCECTI